jgi:multidrug resistance efflux pump
MKKYLLLLLIIGIGGFFIYNKIYIPKHTFKTISAQKSDMTIKVSGTGKVGAKNIYKISSLYGGEIFDFNINEGDFIEKGKLIAKIDSVDLKDKIDEQKAMIKKLQYDIKALYNDMQSLKVKYNYQKEVYQKNKKLFLGKSISALEFEKYKTDYEIAKIAVDTIDLKIKSLKAQITQIQTNIKALKKRLSKYEIRSNISGFVIKKYVSNHQIVMPSQVLIEVVSPNDVWVETFIDTRVSGEVKIGNKATIKLRSKDKILHGKVVNIKPINNAITYEREIDIGFDNLPIPFYMQEQAIIDIKIKKLNNIIN